MKRVLLLLTALLTFGQPCAADTYTYDAMNRLSTVTYSDGSIVSYTYDAPGNIGAITTTVPPGGNPAAVLTGLFLSVPSALKEHASVTVGAIAVYSNGSSKAVTPVLSLTGTAASLSSGVLSAGQVTQDQVVTLNGSYNEGGVTKTVTQNVTILDSSSPTSLQTFSLALPQGWSLLGNGGDVPLDVGAVFGDSNNVTSVWKWVPAGTTPGVSYPGWAFYTPLQMDGGQTYAASRGFDYLITIDAGEGFWVNAASAFTASLPIGAALQSSSFMPAVAEPLTAGGARALGQGWSLLATGDRPTPAQFDAAIATVLSTMPAGGQVYENLISMWSWDATLTRWYFWAPSLVNIGALPPYIGSRNYLDFAVMPSDPAGTLSPTTGFWVNMP